MKLILLRHGQTQWNLAGKLQGWRDSPLTTQAKRQLSALPQTKLQNTVIYSSDLGRAQSTARIVANISGTPLTDVPGVESELQLEQRIKSWLYDIKAKYQSDTVLVVSHGEWLRALQNIIAGELSWQQGKGISRNGEPVYMMLRRCDEI